MGLPRHTDELLVSVGTMERSVSETGTRSAAKNAAGTTAVAWTVRVTRGGHRQRREGQLYWQATTALQKRPNCRQGARRHSAQSRRRDHTRSHSHRSDDHGCDDRLTRARLRGRASRQALRSAVHRRGLTTVRGSERGRDIGTVAGPLPTTLAVDVFTVKELRSLMLQYRLSCPLRCLPRFLRWCSPLRDDARAARGLPTGGVSRK